jgi:hypothetical protein
MSAYCSKVVTGGPIPECTVGFRSGGAIHLPPDPSTSVQLGAFTSGASRFVTRHGRFALNDSLRSALKSEADQHPANPPYANLVYSATITGGKVAAVRRVLKVATRVIINAAFGGRTLQGKISTTTGSGDYGSTPTLPIQIKLAQAANIVKDSVGGAELVGTITNAKKPVRLPGGSTLPALSSSSHNPLTGPYTEHIALLRFPSMHAAFADQMVLSWAPGGPTGMGPEFFPSVGTVLGLDPLGKTWNIVLHGIPWRGPSLSLSASTAS